jgi:hypothetical protein
VELSEAGKGGLSGILDARIATERFREGIESEAFEEEVQEALRECKS